MKATITSTDQIVDVDAIDAYPPETGQTPPPTCRIKARVWEGITEEHKRPDPSTMRAIDARFIL